MTVKFTRLAPFYRGWSHRENTVPTRKVHRFI